MEIKQSKFLKLVIVAKKKIDKVDLLLSELDKTQLANFIKKECSDPPRTSAHRSSARKATVTTRSLGSRPGAENVCAKNLW